MRFNGRSDRTIKPGEIEKLAITLSCHKLTGEFRKNIAITTNDPDHPRENLVCKGQILEPLKMTPKQASFGYVSEKAPRLEKKISITRGDGGPLNLKLAPINRPGIEAGVREIEPGERYELVVALIPPFESKQIRATLRLETGVAQSPTVTVPVHAVVASAPRTRPTSRRARPRGAPPYGQRR